MIRFDHRDTGLSSKVDFKKNPYSVFDLANDVIALMNRLEIERAHVVGHSMGGIVSQILAAYHPERCITFTSISVGFAYPSPSIMDELMKNHPTQNYADLYKRSHDQVGVACNHIRAQEDLKDLPTKLQSNTIHGLFIHGAKGSALATPNSTLTVIPNMGHMIFNPALQEKLSTLLLHHFLNFEPLFVGNPIDIENKLKELLYPASKLDENSTYIQILSQIALAQAMQKNFLQAHGTLNKAEDLLRPNDKLSKVHLLLERGRTYMQEGNTKLAFTFFMQSFEESIFDEHTANAAHMIAIVSDTPKEKIKWNSLAIDLVEKSSSLKAKKWLGSLYHNLGQAYDEAGLYEDCLKTTECCLKIREQEGYLPNIRVAKWALGRALRHLNRVHEALKIQRTLLDEYESMVKNETLDIPTGVLPSVRGLVYEELAELDPSQRKHFAQQAYEDLSKDEWFRTLGKKRLDHLSSIRLSRLS